MFQFDLGKRWNGSAESKNLSMRTNFYRENRETLSASDAGQKPSSERSANAHGGYADVHAERENFPSQKRLLPRTPPVVRCSLIQLVIPETDRL